MADYLRKNLRYAFFSFDVLYTYINFILENDKTGELTKNSRKLKTIATYCKSISKDLIKDCDKDQINALVKLAGNYELVIMPTSTAKGLKHKKIVDLEDLNFLINQACGMCFMCPLRGPETKKCPMRPVLLRMECEVHENGKNICPFAVEAVDT